MNTVGMHGSYIKSCEMSMWDNFQLKCVSNEVGGNRAYFEFVKSYEMDTWPVEKRIESPPMNWYKRKIVNKADGKMFTEAAPSKHVNTALKTGKEGAKIAGDGMKKAGAYLSGLMSGNKKKEDGNPYN